MEAKSTATSCRIHVVADLLPKPATKLNVYAATVDFVADFLNRRLSTKSTALNSTLLQCSGLYAYILFFERYTYVIRYTYFSVLFISSSHALFNVDTLGNSQTCLVLDKLHCSLCQKCPKFDWLGLTYIHYSPFFTIFGISRDSKIGCRYNFLKYIAFTCITGALCKHGF